MNAPKINEKIQQALIKATTPGCIIKPGSIPDQYSCDASELRYPPELVVKAACREDVQAVIQLANQWHFPVIPRGGGSGLAGACLADQGGVVLSLENMNRIHPPDTKNLIMAVEPGAVSCEVRKAAEKSGLFYPPDPAGMDRSTIGGNAATDAGGPACLKYGTTRDYILGLEAVLPTGELIRTGVKTRKGVVGYDLTNLIVGSEGTLGIITELTLKIIPKPCAVMGIMAVFKNMGSAMEAVSHIMASSILPCAMEFMDHKCLFLVKDMLPMSLPGNEPSVLIIETDGSVSHVKEEIQNISERCREMGADTILQAKNQDEREKIWQARRQISLCIHDWAALYISEDVVVPINAIADLVNRLSFFEDRYRIKIFAFGHAGDGNIHLNITAPSKDSMDRVNSGVKALLEQVLALGGTISGEHGIGLAKRQYLPMEISPESIALQKGIKTLFDPNNILNPGKIFK
ncbi:MAG: FAD-linked oxidase C-terminal domain-containing protein [Desulfobacteraceae bacterium]